MTKTVGSVGQEGRLGVDRRRGRGADAGGRRLERRSVGILLRLCNHGCEDGVDGKQEEVIVTSGGIRGCCVRRRRSHFHGAEASGHSLEGVI